MEPPPSIAPEASPAAAIAPPGLEKSVEPAAPLLQSGQMVQPTSESIGKDANVDIKTDPAAKMPAVSEPRVPERAAKEVAAPAMEAPAKTSLAVTEPPAESNSPPAAVADATAGVTA